MGQQEGGATQIGRVSAPTPPLSPPAPFLFPRTCSSVGPAQSESQVGRRRLAPPPLAGGANRAHRPPPRRRGPLARREAPFRSKRDPGAGAARPAPRQRLTGFRARSLCAPRSFSPLTPTRRPDAAQGGRGRRELPAQTATIYIPRLLLSSVRRTAPGAEDSRAPHPLTPHGLQEVPVEELAADGHLGLVEGVLEGEVGVEGVGPAEQLGDGGAAGGRGREELGPGLRLEAVQVERVRLQELDPAAPRRRGQLRAAPGQARSLSAGPDAGAGARGAG